MSDGAVPEIDVQELARRRGDGIHLVDVRETDEYIEVHVPGAVLLPLSELADRAGEIPTEGTVHLICRSGARSMTAGEFLAAMGIDAVNIAGGTLAWIDAGFEVATGIELG